MKLIRTDASNLDFIELVKQLDAYLAIQDGEEHSFYDQYNQLDDIKYVLLFYIDEVAVGCGAIKAFDKESMEVKRMFVLPKERGKGFATKLLSELEIWAKELGFKKTILETGKKQSEAIALYKKSNYQIIDNYGQYKNMDNSVCFEKQLS